MWKGCEDFPNPGSMEADEAPASEHAADVDREDAVEIIAGGGEIVIHGELWLNKKFSD